MRVAVTGRTPESIEAVAAEIGGLALEGDASRAEDVERWVETTERELGSIELLVCNAGISGSGKPFLEESGRVVARLRGERPRRVPVLPCRRASDGRTRAGPDREHGKRRLVPADHEPDGALGTSYGASKAALGRFSETLAAALAPVGIRVFLISPGLVRTEMTETFGDNAPWTPPELAPRLVRVLASGRADALAGRYIHAEHDDIEDLIARADEIAADDLNAIRLRR